MLVDSRNEPLPLFIAGFVALFVFSGLGNGSMYRMIPAIFMAKCTGTGAYPSFLVFHGVCFALTWAVYLRCSSTGNPALV